MDNFLKWLSVATAAAIAFLVDLPSVYRVLAAFMVLDMFSGVIRGYVHKELAASVAWHGVLKKGGEVVIVIMAAFLQGLVPGLEGVPLAQALAGFYVYYEGLSVIENAAAIGVPIPQFLRDALAKLSPEKDIPPVTGERRARK